MLIIIATWCPSDSPVAKDTRTTGKPPGAQRQAREIRCRIGRSPSCSTRGPSEAIQKPMGVEPIARSKLSWETAAVGAAEAVVLVAGQHAVAVDVRAADVG